MAIEIVNFPIKGEEMRVFFRGYVGFNHPFGGAIPQASAVRLVSILSIGRLS